MAKKSLLAAALTFLFLLTQHVFTAYAQPHVQLPPPDGIKASKAEMGEIDAFYGKVEEALARKDLDAVMSFYADDYNHNGITKATIKGLWSSIFNNYDKIYSVHFFSDVNVQKNEAVIQCTGTLLGIPRDSKDNQYVSIDRWINQNHWLSRKGGSWQVVGGATHWMSEINRMPGGKYQYSLEYHPLF